MLQPFLPANEQLAEAFTEVDEEGRQRSLMGAIETVGADGLQEVVVAQCTRGRLHIRSIAHPIKEPTLGACPSSSSTAPAPPANFLQEVTVEVAAEDITVTALLWLAPNPNSATNKPMLCLGFSHGGVTILSPKGKPCASFLLCQRPVVCLRPGLSSGSNGDVCQLLVLHEGNEVASVSLAGITARVVAVDSGQDVVDDGASVFVFDIYHLREREETSDICVFPSCRPLEDVFACDVFPCAVAVGTLPFLSQHVITEGSSKSLFANATSAVKAAFSIATSLWGKVSSKNAAPVEPARGFDPLEAPLTLPPAGLLKSTDIQVRHQGSSISLSASGRFLDRTRVALKPLDKPYPCESLVIAPPLPLSVSSAAVASTLAATCDDFGRVGLFCLETLRCLHLWKGYRDAQVAWLREPAVGQDASCALGLIIYAPKRGLLELWDIVGDDSASPKRLDAVVVDMDCRLLACPGSSRPAVYLLRPDGRLDNLRWNPIVASLPRHLPSDQSFESVDSEEADHSGVDDKECIAPIFSGSDGYPQQAAEES